jgi:hypothetical protein
MHYALEVLLFLAFLFLLQRKSRKRERMRHSLFYQYKAHYEKILIPAIEAAQQSFVSVVEPYADRTSGFTAQNLLFQINGYAQDIERTINKLDAIYKDNKKRGREEVESFWYAWKRRFEFEGSLQSYNRLLVTILQDIDTVRQAQHRCDLAHRKLSELYNRRYFFISEEEKILNLLMGFSALEMQVDLFIREKDYQKAIAILDSYETLMVVHMPSPKEYAAETETL